MLAGALDTISAAVGTLAATPLWTRRDADVVAECESLHVLEQRVAGLKLALLGELDHRGLARELGATSTIGWLRWRLRVSASGAGAQVRLARQLRQFPTTARRLVAGKVTVDQAKEVIGSLIALPADLDDRADGDWATVDNKAPAAGGARPDAGVDTGAPVAGGAPPDAGSPVDIAAVRMDGAAAADNGVPAKAQGATDDGTPAGVVGRVERLLLEHADALDPQGLRVAGRHALATIAPDLAEEAERRALAAAERRAFAARKLDLFDDAAGGTVVRGYLDREATIVLRTALDPLSAPRGTGDDRSAGQRRADALTEICTKVLTGGGLPAQGGQPTQVVVTTRYDVLQQALGTGCADTGEQVSAETLRRMACDAHILPAVLGSGGQVLDVGRARRLFTGSLRRALNLRDRGCAFPGCDRGVDWTQAHHLLSWLDGGPTDLNNGVLVCKVHHRCVHEPDGWQVRLGRDGLPEFIPPEWIDPLRRPLRNIRLKSRAP